MGDLDAKMSLRVMGINLWKTYAWRDNLFVGKCNCSLYTCLPVEHGFVCEHLYFVDKDKTWACLTFDNIVLFYIIEILFI